MALKRVTMQDIADACDLSRNTVSKIFNGRGSVPEATRRKVLATAERLGYALPREKEDPPQDAGDTIAMLTGRKGMTHNFGSSFSAAFADAISRAGRTLRIYEVSPEEIENKELPPHLHLDQTAGILCMELFDRGYLDMLSELRVPVLTMDGYAGMSSDLCRCDRVYMENFATAKALTRHMIGKGAKLPGFVGDCRHCSSFFLRWQGFRQALEEAGMPYDPACCILEDDAEPYDDPAWIEEQLRDMPKLPDAFFCANDFIALKLITAVKNMGLSIPEEVMIAGFDGSPESEVITPALTTASIPSIEIGRTAAAELLHHIQKPERPPLFTLVATTPIYRASTDRRTPKE
jgi:Transcriptional regulators